MTGKILIIDDEPDILETLKNVLTYEGFQVKTALSGEDALEMFASEPFDLVITDIRMPGMDGLDVLKRVKELDDEIEVIVLTGFATIDNAILAMRHNGAFDYLHKPMESIDELIHTVTQALEKRRLRRENKQRAEALKKAHEELKESEAQKKAILDSSIDRIRLVDREMRIIWANKTTTRGADGSPEGLVGARCYELFVERDSPCSGCPTQEAIASGRTAHAVIHHTHWKGIEGDTYWDTYAVPLKSESGEVGHIIQISRNITEAKRMEEEKRMLEAQILQAQKMEALGTLAGGIAHNFNNLLTGILGNTSMMLLEIDPEHSHFGRLKNIEQLINTGSQLTKQLLGYARKGNYESKLIDVNELVQETSRTFATTRRDITIHQELDHNLCVVRADQGQIEQILWNLYVNAADAMPGGGDLFLSTRDSTHKEIMGTPFKLRPGQYVVLTVRDTGVGMDKKTAKRVFEPFFTTKGLAGGTGLGLSSVYGTVKAHGGYIDMESKKGKGTTFTIYLPASKREVPRKQGTPKKPARGRETILLVDDEQAVLKVSREMLEALGYTVISTNSGREAIENYNEKKDAIDLVLLDMIMPGMSGGETYDRLKEIDPAIKVLLSSGYDINGQANAILERGCDGFIQKPFDFKELSRKVKEVLHRE